MRRVLFKAILPYFLVIIFTLFKFNVYIGATIVALFLIYIVYFKDSYIIFLIFFALGLSVSMFTVNRYEKTKNYIRKLDEYSGIVTKLSLDKKVCYIKNNKERYSAKIIFKTTQDITVGEILKVRGRIEEGDHLLYSRDINFLINSNEVIKLGQSKNLIVSIYKLSDCIKRKMYSIDKYSAPFINGLISGDIDSLEEELKNNFIDLNLKHIVVVSGAHLGIVTFFTMIVFSFNYFYRIIATILFTTFYLILTGFSISAFRAYIMIVFILIGRILKKHTDSINLLILSMFVMTALNSYIIFNLSFILSVASVIGIYSVNPFISKYIDERLSVSISTLLTTLPITLYINGDFTIYSIILNAIISPLVGILTIISLISVMFSMALPYTFVFKPILFLGRFFLDIVRIAAKFNYKITIGQVNLIFILLYYLLLFILIDKIKLKNKKIVMLTIILIIISLNVIPNNKLTISFVDVGQGDSIFITTKHGKTILIDTGANIKEYNAAKQRVIPFIKKQGYNKIDLMIITHFHNDHAGGADYLINNFKIYNKCAYEPENTIYKSIKNGDELEIDGLKLEFLVNETKGSLDDNERCLVIKGKYYEFDFLLTADASLEMMNRIKGDFEVVKMPHHGSRFSFDENILNNISMQLAIFTVGKNNFNHPSPEVIDLLETNDIKYYRTDRDGSIQILTDGKKLYLKCIKGR
ncbi:MAG: DNA internalization-related competence protein ComEC/Rec2 [Clostridiales bacterium]|nr:DNA internalization-related competence protein ComEC/Rec2 [Clostridiales bacterium]